MIQVSGKGSMFTYRICGYTFSSSIPIPELAPAEEGPTQFTFQLCIDTAEFSESCHWLNHWNSVDGTLWLAFARVESGYLLRFPALADFVISADASLVSCYLREKCPLETMRHLLLNQVIPIVLSHGGKLVLHASACATQQGVMAFMGVSGMGKSTLAASFGLRGFTVLTDDCLLVEKQDEKVMTVPSYPGLRLWPETVEALFEEEPELQPLAHYTDKKRFLFDQDHFDGSLALSAIYILTEPEDMSDIAGVTITPLAASDALLEAVKHTFQLDLTDRERLGQAFRQYEWLAKSVPFFKLSFPREHEFLPEVDLAILNHLGLIQDQRSPGS